MKGWLILRHAIRQVTGNLPEALQLTLVPFLIMIVLSFMTYGQIGGLEAEASVGQSLMFMISIVAMVMISVWVAVVWHRYVLLNDRPKGFIPEFPKEQILSYFGWSLGYGLLLVITLFITNIALGALVVAFGPSPEDMANLLTTDADIAGGEGGRKLLTLVIGILVQVPVMTVALRLMTVLPATAVKRKVPFFAGWKATAGHTMDLIVLAFLCTIITFGVTEITSFIFAEFKIWLAAFDIVFSWVITVVGASILTTLYGHYVEGRELV